MYHFQDDTENVKGNSPPDRVPFQPLTPRKRAWVRGFLSFLEQGRTFRDKNGKRKIDLVSNPSCFYKNKIEIIGNRIEGTEYEIPVCQNFQGNDTSKNRGKSEHTEENRKKAARRAKQALIDKVDSTFAFIDKKYPHLFKKGWRVRHLILTYKEEMECRTRLAADWEKAEKRFKTYFVSKGLCTEEALKDIHYVVTAEIQKEREQKTGKKVWHLHVIIFSPYTSLRDIYRVWGFGSVKIKKRDLSDVSSLGLYLAKYMSKDFDEGTFNKKRFFCSRNVRLYKIRFMENARKLQDVMNMFARYAVEEKPFIYQSEWLGVVSGCVLLLARTDEVYQFLKFWTG